MIWEYRQFQDEVRYRIGAQTSFMFKGVLDGCVGKLDKGGVSLWGLGRPSSSILFPFERLHLRPGHCTFRHLPVAGEWNEVGQYFHWTRGALGGCSILGWGRALIGGIHECGSGVQDLEEIQALL